jgi:pimeloyl-ACP methyl ester carboxylesterase
VRSLQSIGACAARRAVGFRVSRPLQQATAGNPHIVVRVLLLGAMLAALSSTASAESLARPASKPVEYCASGVNANVLVRLRLRDGAHLVGITAGSGKTGVLLLHQNGSDFCEWALYAQELAADGYRTLALSFRGFGSSRAPRRVLGRLDRDVAAGVAALKRRGAGRVVVVGASMGGTAALVAAATLAPTPASVISLSAPATFGELNALRTVSKLRVPALFVAARGDGGSPADARALHARTHVRGSKLLLVAGGLHGVSLLGSGPPRVRATLAAFIRLHG